MNSKKFETINMMEVLITREIQRLAEAADVTVFVRYADSTLKGGPLDFVLVDKDLPRHRHRTPDLFRFPRPRHLVFVPTHRRNLSHASRHR